MSIEHVVLGFFTLVVIALLVVEYLITCEVMHSIEDIKHLLIATRNPDSGDDWRKFLTVHNEPPKPGDVKFHIPSSLLDHDDE